MYSHDCHHRERLMALWHQVLTWDAEQVRITKEEGQTHTLVGVLVTLGSYAAHHTLAALLAAAVDTHLRVLAQVGGRTLVRDTGAAREGVAAETVLTLAGRSVAGNDTCGAGAT